ncbi:hypothetical protein L1856_04980 [Streptomyces sp. Tue 6430]|nr:hypothetical protein [Streptomyces sp. Tue 6430]
MITSPHRTFKNDAPTGTRRCTSGSAKPTRHDASAASTASPTWRTGEHVSDTVQAITVLLSPGRLRA